MKKSMKNKKTAHELVAEYWNLNALKKHLLIHGVQFNFDLQVFKQSKDLKQSDFSYMNYGDD